MSGESSAVDTSQGRHEEQHASFFQCSICGAQYHRIDHLVRHVRTHTKQRPYVCKICSKAFGRQDLMKRHETAHGVETAVAVVPKRPNRTGDRVPRACKLCSSKKLKCSGETPCQRCRSKQTTCEYGKHGERFRNSCVEKSSAKVVEGTVEFSSLIPVDIPDNSIEAIRHSSNDDAHENFDLSMSGLSYQDSNSFPSIGLLSHPLDLSTSIQVDNVSPDYSWDLNSTDFAFLEGMDDRWILEPPKRIGTMERPMFAMGSTAFKNSSATRLWEPQSSENYELERRNLALGDGYDHVPQTQGHSLGPQVDFLSTANRDRILQMILAVSSSTNAAKVLASFPSSETLTNLILNYLTKKKYRQVGDFIHLPTFNINQQRPELIGALVAIGAVATDSPSVRSFGYALQEVVRLTILRLFEEDNSSMRDIGICQAFFLQQHVAFFSGVRRKIDLAEACSMAGGMLLSSLFAMLRKADATPLDAFIDNSESCSLAWHDWSARESMARFVYFIYNLDAQISMARSRPTHYSFNRMTLKLPSPEAVWQAATPQMWRAMYADQNLMSPSLMALLQDPGQLGKYETQIDLRLARICVLSGLWSMIWECRQMHQLARSSNVWNQFLLDSRTTELYSALQLCSTESLPATKSHPEVDMLHQILSMHLHVSFQDLVAFAGDETENERTESLTYAESWVDTKACRTALWHAGQALAVASDLPECTLDDIHVTCLFQAAVVLWTYGVLVKSKPANNASNDVFILNSHRTGERSRMPIRHHGRPSLATSESNISSLDNPAATMEYVANILQRNWHESSMPRYSEEIARLLLDLGQIVR